MLRDISLMPPTPFIFDAAAFHVIDAVVSGSMPPLSAMPLIFFRALMLSSSRRYSMPPYAVDADAAVATYCCAARYHTRLLRC